MTYGEDFTCVEDLNPNLTVTTGPLVVAEAVARRLQTPRGGLWYDPDYGTDMRQFIGSPRVSRFAVTTAAENEAIKDERVEAAFATVEIAEREMRITVRLVLAEGPFDLVVDVGDLDLRLVAFDRAA